MPVHNYLQVESHASLNLQSYFLSHFKPIIK
nr:MAG TPA: hypothetical protein [Caudoviricetes sp.]